MPLIDFNSMYGACPYPSKEEAEKILYDPKDIPKNPIRLIRESDGSELIITPEQLEEIIKITELEE